MKNIVARCGRFLIIGLLAVMLVGTGMTLPVMAYDPPFELGGVVRSVASDHMKVYLPYVDQELTVHVMKETVITDRVDDSATPRALSVIRPDDLVLISGIVKNNTLLSQKISYLSLSK